MTVFITQKMVSPTNQAPPTRDLVVEHLPAHPVRWAEGGMRLQMCMDIISDLKKYLLIIMLAVQKTEQNERRTEAERTLRRQWHYFT